MISDKETLLSAVIKSIQLSGMSYHKIEEATGVSRETIRSLAKGIRNTVSLEILFKISNYFSIDYRFETPRNKNI